MSEKLQDYLIALIGFTMFLIWFIFGAIVITEVVIFIARLKCIFCRQKQFPKIK
jgi:uncharacterized membrane protein